MPEAKHLRNDYTVREFNKLPIRQDNKKNGNLSEQLKSIMLYIVSLPIIITCAVRIMDAMEYNSAEILSVLS
jgi:hypothetical protein